MNMITLKVVFKDHQDLLRRSCKTLYQEEEREAGREKRWEDHIMEWTGLTLNGSLRKSEARKGWRKLTDRSSSKGCPHSQKTTG